MTQESRVLELVVLIRDFDLNFLSLGLKLHDVDDLLGDLGEAEVRHRDRVCATCDLLVLVGELEHVETLEEVHL